MTLQKNSALQKSQTVRIKPGSLKRVGVCSQAEISCCPGGVGLGLTPVPKVLTSTTLLIRPVPTVILSVTFPPVGDAVAILTVELKVAGTVWGFCGVFCRNQTHQSFPLQRYEPETSSVYLPKGHVPGHLSDSPKEHTVSSWIRGKTKSAWKLNSIPSS